MAFGVKRYVDPTVLFDAVLDEKGEKMPRLEEQSIPKFISLLIESIVIYVKTEL